MRNSTRDRLARGLAVSGITLIGLAGCSVGPDYHRPSTPVDAQYLNIGQPGLAEGAALERYWTTFNEDRKSVV